MLEIEQTQTLASQQESLKRFATEIIGDEFHSSLVELFRFYSSSNVITTAEGCDASADLFCRDCCDLNSAREMVTSSIGICGSDFRCSIGLLAHVETVSSLCQGMPENPTDWIGELTNQLAGRFKNNLSEYQVHCQMGLPVSVRGLQLGFMTGFQGQTIQMVDLKEGPVVVLLHVNIEPDVQWEYHPELESADEGSLHLF
ncbi:hypothetical protein [Roseiconus lacunae]|uniref:hypothetical protein n=1 Tax=Roseiconus lacunae TaxID=2605694 RepID=UPI001E6574FA|nr:hypothetical protein [Roseiconus lacunae]MCD0461077.1 hypothetical protein [Roseiconus lacunae]